VIVDDVYTTGATLTWAARTIQEANPASISAMVIAIADPRGKDFEAI
jgi:predicted amidophosphoribosyltransferase